MKAKRAAGIVATVVGIFLSQSAWCDQQTAALTPTAAQIENIGGVTSLYLTTTQPAVNPAGCTATDAYIVIDPKILDEVLAMSLTAITTSRTIAIVVSGSQCSSARPVVLSLIMNW
jgi:hypothetical protein